MSEKVKKTGKFAIVFGVILAMVGVYFLMPQAKAAQISSRNVTISNPRPSATGVSFDFQGNTTATTTRCIQMQFCTTATGSCTTPSGLTTTSATKVTTGWNVFNQTNWTLNNSTNGTLKLTYATGENGGNNSSWVVGNITNPSSAGTYFVRINTYSDSNCSTGYEIDNGVVAFAIVSGVSVSATVAETLTFSISDIAIGFGEMNTSNIRYATGDEAGSPTEPGNGEPSQLSVSTNAANGVFVSIQDTGNGTNAGLYSAGASKLIAATAPNAVAGGTESYAPYAKNASGLTIQSGWDSSGSSVVSLSPQLFVGRTSAGSGTVDLAAKAGISTSTPAGSYSDTLILIATPTY